MNDLDRNWLACGAGPPFVRPRGGDRFREILSGFPAEKKRPPPPKRKGLVSPERVSSVHHPRLKNVGDPLCGAIIQRLVRVPGGLLNVESDLRPDGRAGFPDWLRKEETALEAQIAELGGRIAGADSIAGNLSSTQALLAKLRKRPDQPVSWEQKRRLIEVLVGGRTGGHLRRRRRQTDQDHRQLSLQPARPIDAPDSATVLQYGAGDPHPGEAADRWRSHPPETTWPEVAAKGGRRTIRCHGVERRQLGG